MWRGLIEQYRDRLPVTSKTPVITLHEGNTPLVPAPVLSDPWCPRTRRVAANDNLSTAAIEGPPGYLGVYIVYTHPFITGLFGSERVLTSQAIVKLEPQTLF